MNYYFLDFVNEVIIFKVSDFLAHIVSGIEGDKQAVFIM